MDKWRRRGSYHCYSCDFVLGEPFFCRGVIERFAAAMAFVGYAIKEENLIMAGQYKHALRIND